MNKAIDFINSEIAELERCREIYWDCNNFDSATACDDSINRLRILRNLIQENSLKSRLLSVKRRLVKFFKTTPETPFADLCELTLRKRKKEIKESIVRHNALYAYLKNKND